MGNPSNDFLAGLGFGFPENEEQLEKFDQVFENYEFKGNPDKINSFDILKKLKASAKKPTNVDYHRRTVLAAEIVYKLHMENTLGHLKLQKIMYLCQNSIHMDLHTNFLKQAMGPYDPTLMRSLDKKFRENQWFCFTAKEYLKYQPLAKVGGHREWFLRYFENQVHDIDHIIEKFRKVRTKQVELIATVFACWKEAIEQNQLVNNEVLIAKFYNWHEDKAKFKRDEISSTIKWMSDEGFYPAKV